MFTVIDDEDFSLTHCFEQAGGDSIVLMALLVRGQKASQSCHEIMLCEEMSFYIGEQRMTFKPGDVLKVTSQRLAELRSTAKRILVWGRQFVQGQVNERR